MFYCLFHYIILLFTEKKLQGYFHPRFINRCRQALYIYDRPAFRSTAQKSHYFWDTFFIIGPPNDSGKRGGIKNVNVVPASLTIFCGLGDCCVGPQITFHLLNKRSTSVGKKFFVQLLSLLFSSNILYYH